MARPIDRTPEARDERAAAAKNIPLKTPEGKTIAIVVTGAKGTGVVEVDRETGRLGGSTFVRDLQERGIEVRNIGVLPSERRRFETAESKEERKFTKRRKELEAEEAKELRAKELEREAKFKPPEEAKRYLHQNSTIAKNGGDDILRMMNLLSTVSFGIEYSLNPAQLLNKFSVESIRMFTKR